MRLLGAALLVAGATAIGLGALRSINGRVKDISGLICGLEGMKRGLASNGESLERMLLSASKGTHGRPGTFFDAVHTGLDSLDGGSFCRLWEETMGQAGLLCSGEDLEILSQLGGIMGGCDAEGQLAALEKAIGALNAALEEAKEQSRTTGRLYVTLSASCGVLLAILLI